MAPLHSHCDEWAAPNRFQYPPRNHWLAVSVVFFALLGTDLNMYVGMIAFGIMPSLAQSIHLSVAERGQADSLVAGSGLAHPARLGCWSGSHQGRFHPVPGWSVAPAMSG